MGGMVPLGDASRRPRRIPFITILIILVNAFVFLLELTGGEAGIIFGAAPGMVCDADLASGSAANRVSHNRSAHLHPFSRRGQEMVGIVN